MFTRSVFKMVNNGLNPLVVGISGVVLVALFTIPTIVGVVSQIRQPKPKTRTYQDRDGASTEVLTSACSAIFPKAFLLVLGILGLSTSVVIVALGGPETHSGYTSTEDWLNAGQWVNMTTILSNYVRWQILVSYHHPDYWNCPCSRSGQEIQPRALRNPFFRHPACGDTLSHLHSTRRAIFKNWLQVSFKSPNHTTMSGSLDWDFRDVLPSAARSLLYRISSRWTIHSFCFRAIYVWVGWQPPQACAKEGPSRIWGRPENRPWYSDKYLDSIMGKAWRVKTALG